MAHDMSEVTPGRVATLSPGERHLVLLAAFLGWMFAGTQMSITPLVARSAASDLLQSARPKEPVPGGRAQGSRDQLPEEIPEAQLGKWFAWYNAAFLLGAALGGLVFGWFGDRAGRAKAMGLCILCYTALSGLSYYVSSVEQLLVLRFLACLGVGGMWPNGIALVCEAWPEVSRPMLAGLIGTAANVGILVVAVISIYYKIRPESWRWVMLVGAAPLPLGIIVWAMVPESPRWLAGMASQKAARGAAPVAEIFWPPLLRLTIIGICLGTIPLLGGWGSGNWLTPWADKVGGAADPHLKGWTHAARSLGGTLGSLAGGWLAGALGRRRSYFLISLGSLLTSAYIFRTLTPMDGQFLWVVCLLGTISGLYFGWLPLCLPELFPTRVRSTGAGVTFNFGRVVTAVGVLGAGELIKSHYQGDYARVSAVVSLVYALGMVIIWLAPDTTGKRLED